MVRKIYIACCLLIILLLAGCERELDFKYDRIDPILVIEGALTEEGAEVTLRYTSPMDEAMDMTSLTDAEVMITDITTDENYHLAPDSKGVFRSSIGGIAGRTYRLTVKRGDAVYTSESLMRENPDIIDMGFSWIKMPYDYVAVLQVSFTDDPATKDDCYWMRIYRNGEIYAWSEISDLLAHDGILDVARMTSRRDLDEEDESDRLEKGDIVKITIAPISRAFHDYLEALSAGNSNGPQMFEGDFCLGYFLAAPLAEKEIIFPGFEE